MFSKRILSHYVPLIHDPEEQVLVHEWTNLAILTNTTSHQHKIKEILYLISKRLSSGKQQMAVQQFLDLHLCSGKHENSKFNPKTATN